MRAATIAPSPTLAGKTVLVTGSSRGVGRAIAVALGRAGARVVINSFHSRDDGEAVASAIRGAGGDAAHVWGSVANPAHVEAMFDSIAREVGELHHFISNASNGRFGPSSRRPPSTGSSRSAPTSSATTSAPSARRGSWSVTAAAASSPSPATDRRATSSTSAPWAR